MNQTSGTPQIQPASGQRKLADDALRSLPRPTKEVLRNSSLVIPQVLGDQRLAKFHPPVFTNTPGLRLKTENRTLKTLSLRAHLPLNSPPTFCKLSKITTGFPPARHDSAQSHPMRRPDTSQLYKS